VLGTGIASTVRETPTADDHDVSYREAFWVWCRVAALSFGGPAGQIAVMHRILVEEKRWVSENRFLHALNYCMLLPGPEAQQLAVYIGWLLHRTIGGLTAGILFVLPGFVSILVLSVLYATYNDVAIVEAIFYGLKPAVVAVVIEAVMRIGKRALKNRVMIGIAAAAFVAIFFLEVPFPLIIAAAAALGFVGGKIWPDTFVVIKGHKAPNAADERIAISDDAASTTRPSMARALRVLAICLPIWLGPVFLLHHFAGPESVYTQQAKFFSKAAMVTFGGAYSVLAYVADECVKTYGWLGPDEMLDGLGMAETTPGPLIQVVQFVGFMGAFRNPGPLTPLAAGIAGSLITTWVTYAPCFMWIFMGAPYIEFLRGRAALNAALSTVTAAVVGVILNLSIWFAMHTLFESVIENHLLGIKVLTPVWETVDVFAVLIAIGALIAMLRFHVGMMKTLAVAAILGAAYYLTMRT
jgi:chromate transporter